MFNLSLFLNKLLSSCCQHNSIFLKCMCFKLCINIILWTVYKRALLVLTVEFVLKVWNLSRIRSCSIQSFRRWCGEPRNILKMSMLCCYIWYNQGCATSAELSCLAYFTPQLLKIIMCKCTYSCAVIIELLTSKQEACYGWGKPNKSTFSVLLLNLFHPSSGRDVMTLSMGISNRSGCWNF